MTAVAWTDDVPEPPEEAPPIEWDDGELPYVRHAEPDGASPIVWADQLSAPIAPPEWICRGLRLARGGRPNIIAGENGSMKSTLGLGLAVAGAADRRFLGVHDVAAGLTWLVLDYEAGYAPYVRKAQRVARGLGIELASLGRRFGYAFRPLLWNAPDAREQLLRLVAGVDVVIVDPLTACTSGIDENSRAAREPLDLAIDVTATTGTSFVFVDHAGKPAAEGSPRKRKHAQRGHSSKTDASQTLIVMSSADKGEPALVTCEREQLTGAFFADFRLRLEDVASPDGADPHWGLRLVLLEPPRPTERTPEAAHVGTIEAIRKYLRLHPEGVAGVELLAKRLGMRAADVRAAWKEIEAAGEGRNAGSRSRPKLLLDLTGGAT
jgi:hypothetical protein